MIFIDCGDCDGTGRDPEEFEPCPACGGAGIVADGPTPGVRIEDGPRIGDGIDYAVDRARDRAVGL